MVANNEIGVLQPLEEIGSICDEYNIVLHTDAAQALGKIPFDVRKWNIGMASLTAHKIHGPKGIGALFIRSGTPRIRLQSLIDGGGHERGFRSGTLNVPAIVGFAKAVELAIAEREQQQDRIRKMRDMLYQLLSDRIDGVQLNGPVLDSNLRLNSNLNCCFEAIDGQSLTMQMEAVAVSTGSACTSANPEPSHVLRAIGLSEDSARSSIRFGLSRMTTETEIECAVDRIEAAINRLKKFQ